MFRELLSLFRPDDPVAELGADFQEMLGMTRDLALRAGTV